MMARFEANVVQPAPNCGNCKHWGLDDEYGYMYKNFPMLQKCMRIELLDDCYEWNRKGDEVTYKIKDETMLAFTQDASSYRADLITKAEFMCNMWERK